MHKTLTSINYDNINQHWYDISTYLNADTQCSVM